MTGTRRLLLDRGHRLGCRHRSYGGAVRAVDSRSQSSVTPSVGGRRAGSTRSDTHAASINVANIVVHDELAVAKRDRNVTPATGESGQTRQRAPAIDPRAQRPAVEGGLRSACGGSSSPTAKGSGHA